MTKRLLIIPVGLAITLAVPATAQQLLGPPIPVGSLGVSPESVQVGDKPTLTWSVQYPETVHDVVRITSSGALETKRPIRIQVRVVGTAFESDGSQLPVELRAQVGETDWQLLFSGRDIDVDPEAFLLDETVPAGTAIHLAGVGHNQDWRTTSVSGDPVAALADGWQVPSAVPVSDGRKLEGFLSQFVSPQSEVILGPLEILYLFELGNRETDEPSFDLQDLAVVVMFAEAK